jgi:hypothetical protein
MECPIPERMPLIKVNRTGTMITQSSPRCRVWSLLREVTKAFLMKAVVRGFVLEGTKSDNDESLLGTIS